MSKFSLLSNQNPTINHMKQFLSITLVLFITRASIHLQTQAKELIFIQYNYKTQNQREREKTKKTRKKKRKIQRVVDMKILVNWN